MAVFSHQTPKTMKNLVTALLLFFSFSFTAQANVVLKNFQATTDGRYTRIVWELGDMEQEVTCLLERSIDGLQYNTVNTFPVKQGFRGKMNAVDNDLLPGIYYYRLRMVKPGFIPYVSPVVSIRITELAETGTAFKVVTPIHNQLTLVGTFTAPLISIEVADLSGRVHLSRQIQLNGPSDRINVDATSLTEGTYILRIREEKNGVKNTVYIRRVIKKMTS